MFTIEELGSFLAREKAAAGTREAFTVAALAADGGKSAPVIAVNGAPELQQGR
jgi:hypothetical protein